MASKMKIIDLCTLEVWDSVRDCAKELKVCPSAICNGIMRDSKIRGRRLEYFDYWIEISDKEKEKYSKRNNIYFLRGGNLERIYKNRQ